MEYQAAWVNAPGGWPAGGPFITRTIPCRGQDRLYYADAWLYAPNRDKYEYMISSRPFSILSAVTESQACPSSICTPTRNTHSSTERIDSTIW